MDLMTLVKSLDAPTARAFVTAARHVIDALMIEGERIQQTQAPAPRDYNAGALDRTAPAGGWLSHAELRDTTQRLSEAIAAEKWIDGVFWAVRALSFLGVLA
jgi:hypothetical protein